MDTVKATSSIDTDALDSAIDTLHQYKDAWAKLPTSDKVAHLKQIRQNIVRLAERWVNAAVEAKGIPTDSPWVGEEWISGPWALLQGVGQLILTLEALAQGKTRRPRAVRTRPDGQVIADVFPAKLLDHLILSGVKFEVWMQPEVTLDNLESTMGVFYKQPEPTGKVTLVLGAGNIASIAPLDLLYKLIAEGQVCLLKMNPVNEYLGPVFEEVFAAMVADGFVRFAYGGGDVGEYLTQHPGIEEIHITGSARTHDIIVYGPGEAGQKRKQQNQPRLKKRITSELGAVCPTIVLPGPWTDADIQFQAENIVTQKLHNSGYNCVASQVLVLPENWERTPDLIAAIRSTIKNLPPRVTYYPGTQQRQSAVMDAHPGAEALENVTAGRESEHNVPRTLVTGLDQANPDDICFQEEFFGCVLAQTSLPGTTAAEFLKSAVEFSNETLWGTLAANLIVHPKTAGELGQTLEDALADLKYGAIGVNIWSASNYLVTQAPWGAYPGHTWDDIQSGIGVVHNTLLFDKPQKSIARAPFYPYPRNLLNGEFHLLPKPAWFVTNKQAHHLGRRFTFYEADPGFRHLPGLFFYALLG